MKKLAFLSGMTLTTAAAAAEETAVHQPEFWMQVQEHVVNNDIPQLLGYASNPAYTMTYLPEGVDWTETLRQHGFKTAAMALREDSIRLNDPHLAREPKLAVVMGTEGDGLASDTIAHCDYTVMIPMTHGVDSLNVAAASAVAFYQLGLMSCPE